MENVHVKEIQIVLFRSKNFPTIKYTRNFSIQGFTSQFAGKMEKPTAIIGSSVAMEWRRSARASARVMKPACVQGLIFLFYKLNSQCIFILPCQDLLPSLWG